MEAKPTVFEKYLIALRTPFLIVSLITAAVAGALAFHNGAFNWMIFLAATFGVVLAHAGTNLANDYFDYQEGNYPKQKRGPTGGSFAIQNKLFNEGQILTMAIIFFIISLGIFAYLSTVTSVTVLLLGLIGIAIGLFYTAPPLKLGYRQFGEFASFIGMGPVLFSTVYMALAGNMTVSGLLLSVFFGLQISNILVAAEIPDIKEDRATDKATVAAKWGEDAAIKLFIISDVIGAIALILGVLHFKLPALCLLGILGTVMAFVGYRQMKNGKYVDALGSAINALMISGILIIFALIFGL